MLDITKTIILSDLDGTLLDSKKRISETDRAAIRRFCQLGGKFTFATGRTTQSFEQYISAVDLKIPAILYNGAAIYDHIGKELLTTHPLPDEAKDIALRLLDMIPEAGGEVLRTDGTYVFRNNDYQKLHTKICGIVPNYAELPDIPDGGWLKVLFAMAPEVIPHMELAAQKLEIKLVRFITSSEIFLEMLPTGVTKGSALEEYRKLPGMEGFTFVSIGDFDNDIEMIEAADIGACPANAEESVRQKADIVLSRTNDESAVAELIDRVIELTNKGV